MSYVLGIPYIIIQVEEKKNIYFSILIFFSKETPTTNKFGKRSSKRRRTQDGYPETQHHYNYQLHFFLYIFIYLIYPVG